MGSIGVKVNTLPISDKFALTSIKRVLDGAYVMDNEEALMKMCGREQKKGESFRDFIDDLTFQAFSKQLVIICV